MVFRTNGAYQRWHEARAKFGLIADSARDVWRQVGRARGIAGGGGARAGAGRGACDEWRQLPGSAARVCGRGHRAARRCCARGGTAAATACSFACAVLISDQMCGQGSGGALAVQRQSSGPDARLAPRALLPLAQVLAVFPRDRPQARAMVGRWLVAMMYTSKW